MKPQETAPLVATLAPAALLAPPVIIVGAIVIGLLWLLSGKDEAEKPSQDPSGATETEVTRTSKSGAMAKKVTREDVAEALAYGAKRFSRKEAVAALEALGFRKTSAYKALAPDGKFGSLIEFTPDGLVEWKG